MATMLLALGSAACTGRADDAGPAMELRTVEQLVADPALLTETEAACAKWRASEKPPTSWPAAVFNTCQNVGTAKTHLNNRREIEMLLNAGK